MVLICFLTLMTDMRDCAAFKSIIDHMTFCETNITEFVLIQLFVVCFLKFFTAVFSKIFGL